MIDIEKVRLWSVRFAQTEEFNSLAYPGMIVEEQENDTYSMPQCFAANIPAKVGGQITITLSGRGIFHAGNKNYDCLPGTAFIYRDCDPLASYRTAPGCKWKFLWINFTGVAAERLIADINHHYGYFFIIGQDSPLTQELLDYKQFAGSTIYLNALEGAAKILHFLQLLCSSQTVSRLPNTAKHLVKEVKNEVSKSFNESITSEYLAQKLGVSREHLSKIFHRETGITLRNYRAEQRLDEALSLLLKSNLSCKEIAMICHYGSYTAFFRAFRKAFHISPNEFRKGRR